MYVGHPNHGFFSYVLQQSVVSLVIAPFTIFRDRLKWFSICWFKSFYLLKPVDLQPIEGQNISS